MFGSIEIDHKGDDISALLSLIFTGGILQVADVLRRSRGYGRKSGENEDFYKDQLDAWTKVFIYACRTNDWLFLVQLNTVNNHTIHIEPAKEHNPYEGTSFVFQNMINAFKLGNCPKPKAKIKLVDETAKTFTIAQADVGFWAAVRNRLEWRRLFQTLLTGLVLAAATYLFDFDLLSGVIGASAVMLAMIGVEIFLGVWDAIFNRSTLHWRAVPRGDM